ncbi:MAG TPA: RCC1 domain-containing protein [Planctomycetaceae bacterium]|nr:RCC1 domain-containing protein [Planctomycetaceae bacterium]
MSDTPAGTYTAVDAGAFYSVALRTDGTLVSWGNNFFGQVSGTPTGLFCVVVAGDYRDVAMPASPAPQIAYLKLRVQALVDGGVSLPADGKSLQTKVDAVAAALGRDDVQAAIGSLDAFINQVEAFAD